MSLSLDIGSLNELCCEQCQLQKTPDKCKLSPLSDKNKPVVLLAKLSEYSLSKLNRGSYKVNNGVAKRTKKCVSPLKISLKNQQGTTLFQVVKKQETNGYLDEIEPNNNGKESKKKKKLLKSTESSVNIKVNRDRRDVEGNSLLERLGASITVKKRNSNGKEPAAATEEDSGNLSPVINDDLCDEALVNRLLIDRLSPTGHQTPGILSKSDVINDGLSLSKIASVFSASCADEEDNNNLKENAEQGPGHDNKQKANKNAAALKKLCSLGFNLVPKSGGNGGGLVAESGNGVSDKENTLHGVTGDRESDGRKCGASDNGSNDTGRTNRKCESLIDGDTSPGRKVVGAVDGVHVKAEKSPSAGEEAVSEKPENTKNDSTVIDDGAQVPKKHVRVKNFNLNDKIISETNPKGKTPLDSHNDIEIDSVLCGDPDSNDVEKEVVPDVSVVEPVKDLTTNSGSDLKSIGAKNTSRMGVNSSPNEQVQSDLIASSQSDGVTTTSAHCEPQFGLSDDQTNHLQDDLLRSVTDGENGDAAVAAAAGFNNVAGEDAFCPDSFIDGASTAEEANDDVAVTFSSLSNEDPSIDDAQQNPLLTPDPTPGSEEALNQNFLQTFLNETDPPQGSIHPEGSEYMALERLGQVSGLDHSQSNFDLGSDGETSSGATPMEQLSKQVQSLPNPTPQINVIPQHQMQAPQPPQLCAGLPQTTNSFEALSHMQPPLPPPLYQGYNIYNQNFPTQGPQQLPPRPPLLQKRPQIQARPFQSMAAPPRPKPRGYPSKRSPMRMAAPQGKPPKQRRLDPQPPPPPTRASQPQSLPPVPKIPSGITVTPAKKNLEVNKVANVLASRGITVTPSSASSRQTTPPSNRPQQRQNPVLNIGPGVSITPNSGSRSSGGFAVPNPRRNPPIVNQDIERPERCATVDLTLDDDMPQSPLNRSSGGRHPCNQCTKVFPTSAALENHKASHRTASALPFKCDKCSAQYPNAAGLQQHKIAFHKAKQPPPDLAIPIVDLNHPGARDQLAKCGIHSFLPLSQLQSNSLGYFGIPIVHLDATKEKAVSNLNTLGAGNILVLGKMKTLGQPQTR